MADPKTFFHYTSGRWLYDEENQMRQRYLEFNITKLKQVAGHAQKSRCTNIRKLKEGFNNKVFSIELENGSEVIARLPTPIAGHPHWVVANEVATLDFLRNVLGIPVPKVLDWSAQDPSQNAVGAEYMIIEHAPGNRLGSVWSSMTPAQHFALARGLMEIEQKLTTNTLYKYGSIYFRHDCPTNSDKNETLIMPQTVDTSRYVIGPVPDHSFWPENAENMVIDRGPWDTPLEYFNAVANREITLLQQLRSSPMHVELLQKFLAVLPMILPVDEKVSRAVLWHLDLHGDNIFVDSEDPTKITSIIDWQNTWAAALFMQARFPSIVDCPWAYPEGLIMPALPQGFDNLSEEEKINEEQKLLEIKLKKYYEIGTRRLNPVVFQAMAMMDNDADPTATILRIVSQTREDGPVPLQELLIQIYKNWNGITTKRGIHRPCPIFFTEDEIESARKRAETWAVAFQEYESLRFDLLGKDGWVSSEEYEEASDRFEDSKDDLERLKRRVEDALKTS